MAFQLKYYKTIKLKKTDMKTKITTISFTLLTILVFNVPLTFPQNIAKKIEPFKNEINWLKNELNIPGISVLVAKNNQVLYSNGFGFADVEKKKSITNETCFQLASITKTFASTVIMQLYEEGKLDLNDPVLPYIYEILLHYGIKVDEGIENIKIKHLLAHTSENPPGSYFMYNGDRYGLLAVIASKIEHQSFEDIMLERIIQPLGLESTIPTTLLNQHPEIHAKLSNPYTYDSTGNLIDGKYTQNFSAAAGLISNV